MNWTAFGALAEAAGVAAVVASLIILSFEVRRNTNESRRASMEDATSHRNEFVRMIALDHELSALVERGLTRGELTSSQWFQFNMFIYAVFVEFEFNKRKFEAGDMDADLWQAWLEGYRWWFQYAGVRKWWSMRPAGFTEEFRQFVDAELSRAHEPLQRVVAGVSDVRSS